MVEQPGFSPEDSEVIEKLVNSARGLKQDAESVPFSSALAMLKEGHTRLREASSYNRGEGSVLTAPEPNSFFNSLTPDLRIKALEGLGFVLIGSLTCAVESARRGVWDDNVYISYFNEHIKGVPLSTISTTLKQESGFANNSPEDDTQKVNSINTPNTAETVKILSQNSWRLPNIVRAHHLQFGIEIHTTFLKKAALIFVETCNILFQEPGNPSNNQQKEPSILLPEQRPGFLAELDRIIAGEQNPFARDMDLFLEEMSGKLD